MIETLVATVMLGTVVVTLSPLFGWVIQGRRAADRRQAATQEVANIMERIDLQGWQQLSENSLASIAISDQAQRFLTDARLETKIQAEEGPPASKRVTIELSWKNYARDYVAPVRVTSWFYRKGAAQ